MPIRDMVAAAVGMVIGDGQSAARGRRQAPLVQPTLVVRASTGPVRNGGPGG
jgi:hypothetical protein